ncbi:MAG: leucyl/phenylalanyl-tRNA--protein transferase [Deltaproteobacteria bacterium]|nr:MAG: leucyl/phenylalanyl-tRNA--protein transferase [Deltaproteobacteria bacterium]
MPVFRLPDDRIVFPDPRAAEPSGLLAVGGDLSVERLLAAYRAGIFPWFGPDEPILWWSPDPRFVLFPDELHVGRSLRRALRRRPYEIRFDHAFAEVVRACARAPRPGQSGTWITDDMIEAYVRLHEAGVAHSIEAYEGDTLVGGLYGVAVGRIFCGESMFARADDASKIAFVRGIEWMRRHGLELVDCQVRTDHLERFGARPIPRDRFLAQLAQNREGPGLPTGYWADAGAVFLGRSLHGGDGVE